MHELTDFKLCYVDDNIAWFTTQDVAKAWGDDWNDAPYSCNAGSPYEWRADRNEPEYELKQVAFNGPFNNPDSYAYGNSAWSVEEVNTGAVAWLRNTEKKVNIFAGTTLPEFVRLVKEGGGVAFLDLETAKAFAVLQ